MKDNDINWWYFENSILKYKYHRGAGGAMALKLNEISDTTIKKGGRWTFMAFLQYIHNQIGHLSTGLSQAMKTKVPFRNIAGM